MSPGLPAIAGAAQVLRGRHDDLGTTVGPIELMVDALHRAAADAGSPTLVDRIDWMGVAGGYWRHRDPGRLVGAALGVAPVRSLLGAISGSAPQELVGMAAADLAAGRCSVAAVVGGEAAWTVPRITRAGLEPQWATGPGDTEGERLAGFPRDEALGREFGFLGAPATAYALMEDSLRVALGEDVASHRDRIAQLWSRFSAVAATNPFAWDRAVHPAPVIREATPDNRLIAFPYTKAMVANNTVDMASAVILCRADDAPAMGVAADALVFPHVVTKAHETWLLQARHELHGSPGLAAAGRRAFGLAGVGPDDIDHVDLYACFPAIVQMSARALDLPLDRQLTVTGGLGFAGAPIGNATGQSIAAVVPLVRAGGWGLVHGNGGNATKHTFGLYSARPPARYVWEDCQQWADLRPRSLLPEEWEGAVTVEAATVVFDRTGPVNVVAAVRTVGGAGEARGWATSDVSDLIEETMTVGLAGRRFGRSAAGTLIR